MIIVILITNVVIKNNTLISPKLGLLITFFLKIRRSTFTGRVPFFIMRKKTLNKISKKSPRSLASVDELPLNFLDFSFAVSKIIIIFAV